MHSIDLNERPAIIVWEMTRACRLACVHCRARSQTSRHPEELTADEGRHLLDTIAASRPALLILTGGDPSRRDDLLPLIAHARDAGLRVAFSPSTTPDLLALDFDALRDAGVSRVSVSLDGATSATHNAFRGVARAWDWAMQTIGKLRAARLPFQINSSISARNIAEFPALAEQVRSLAPAGWTIFLVVPTGRAEYEHLPTSEAVERLWLDLLAFARDVPFDVRTTEGQHYRRVVAQNLDGGRALSVPPGINDGKGFMFISHIGEIAPSGFLPLVAGNVRHDDLVTTYRDTPVFRELRNADLLKGKCGCCEFRNLCGGSRARAYGLTGDYLASDPLCAWQP